jgi:hypothetical protein
VLIVVTRPEQRLGCPLDFLEIKVTTAAAQSPLFISAKNHHVVPKKDRFNISSKDHASGM